MARTLTPATQTAIGQPITTPGYLVYLGFSTALRFTSRGVSINWNGYNWVPGYIVSDGVDITLDNDGYRKS